MSGGGLTPCRQIRPSSWRERQVQTIQTGDAPSREEVVQCETLQDFLELDDLNAFRQAFVSKRAYDFNWPMRN